MAGDFVYEIPVRFADVDRAGILYYPRFLNYFHIAFEEFFGAALGLPYADVIQRERVGFPMVHLEVDFRRPLSYGDRAFVTVKPVRLGRSSVEWTYTVRSGRSGETTTEAKATTVCIDLDTMKSVPLPDHHRRLLDERIAR